MKMREKINFKRLEEISLEEIQVLSEENGELEKSRVPLINGSHGMNSMSILIFSLPRNDYTRMAL